MNSQYSTYFSCLVWMDDASVYMPSGQIRQISCNHIYLGIYGVNVKGEVFPLPSTTVPVGTAGYNTYQTGAGQIKAGNIFGPESSPFNTGDTSYAICAKIKVQQNGAGSLIVYYCDLAQYQANIVQCNAVSGGPLTCPGFGPLTASGISTTFARISWPSAPAGIVGYQYVVKTVNTAPTPPVDGTFLDPSVITTGVTGLTASTTYYFFIQTVCAGGVYGPFESVSFTTT